MTVNLADGTAEGGDADGDTLTNIENLYGSDHADVLTAGAESALLIGFDGDDTPSVAGLATIRSWGSKGTTCSMAGRATTC